ncbi:hypothetical protein NQ318_019211 [Aromia moschata]|uniref:Uncharacterized protein n=1 Tax=Aromia moschata TaxID=1265417 RepID=A0AAV8YY55_9CUCU|nr:hypothetical protein NQ318_019211 [Aromia moschata]
MRQNVVFIINQKCNDKNDLIDNNKKKQEKENKLSRTKNKKKTGRKKNKTDSGDEESEEDDAIQFDTDSEPNELMGQESPDSVDPECIFCQILFSEDTRGETWIK